MRRNRVWCYVAGTMMLALLSLSGAGCNPLGGASRADSSYAPGLPLTAIPSPAILLSALAISSGSLSPAFAPSTTNYTATVDNATSSIQLTPAVNDSAFAIEVNGTAVSSGVASEGLSLSVGDNVIHIIVTGEDRISRTDYEITVHRQSNVSTLSALSVSAGSLSPVFDTATTSYAVSAPNGTTSTTVTPTASDSSASITVNGAALASGAASSALSLSLGMNVITVVVTAEDSSASTIYSLVVSRSAPLTVTGLAATSVTLSWPQSNGTGLTYKVYVSGANPANGSFASLSDVTSGTLAVTLTDVGSTTISSGLSSGNSYYFNVVVSDGSGHQTVYAPVGEYFDTNLLLDYPFNGNANDASASANDADLVNNPALVSDRFGNPNGAYEFANGTQTYSSSSQYMSSQSNVGVTGSGPLTMAFWFQALTGHTYNGDRLLSLGANSTNQIFGLYPSGGSYFIWFNDGNGDAATGVPVTTSVWQHWILTYDGTASPTYHVYLNGSELTGLAANHTTTSLPAAKLFIAVTPNLDNVSTGDYDDIRVYSKVLTGTEASRFYTVTHP